MHYTSLVCCVCSEEKTIETPRKLVNQVCSIKYLKSREGAMATIDAFANLTCENFDKTQLILKVITESFDHAPWWTRTVLYFMITLFDTGLATLGSISPGKGTDYGTLRCYRYLVKRTSQGSDQLHNFCHRLFSRPYGATLSLNITCILLKFSLNCKICESINNHWGGQGTQCAVVV